MRTERGRKLGALLEPAIAQLPVPYNLSCHVQFLALHYRLSHMLHFLDFPWALTDTNLFYRLEIQSCNDGKASAVSSIPLALEACLMSSLLTIHSYARLLISANIAYFPIIPLCLPSSRPLKLLTLVSLLYSIFRILLDALYAAGPNTRKPTQPTISQLLATRNAIHNATKTFFFNVHRCSRSLSPHALL